MQIMKQRFSLVFLLRDFLTFGFAFFVSLYFFKDSKLSRHQWLLFFYLMVVFFLIEFLRKPQHNPRNFKERFFNHVKAYILFTFLLVLAYNFLPIHWSHQVRFLAILVALCLLDFSLNYMLVEIIQRMRYQNELKHVVVAGTGIMAKNVERKLFADQNHSYNLKGFIDCNNNEESVVGSDRVLGDLENIDQYFLVNTVDEIVIAMPSTCTREIRNVLSIADYHGVRVKYILDYQEIFGQHYKITRLGHVDAVNIRQLPIDNTYASFFKNCFDKIFSAIVLILLAPVFLAIALLIKIDSPGPVFYFPIRVGRGGKPFRVYKFRSMKENDIPSGGTLSTVENDPRITRIGGILRKYSLDELPQFINVFLGNMSVVGPRPHRRYLNRQLQQSVYKYMIRHYVKPGITGWAQVNGWRGPTDTEEQRKQRTLHDLWYVENWSMWLDIKIIYLTIFSKKAHKSAF